MKKISRDEIIDNWNKYKSVKRMAKELNISWNRIVKELSSNGIIIKLPLFFRQFFNRLY